MATAAFFTNLMLLFFSNNNSYQIKVRFFESCLEKDAAYYDKNNPNEMPSLLATNIDEL
jgi:hypothetical protein